MDDASRVVSVVLAQPQARCPVLRYHSVTFRSDRPLAGVYGRYELCGVCGAGTTTGQVLRPHVSCGGILGGPSIGWCAWTRPAVWSVW